MCMAKKISIIFGLVLLFVLFNQLEINQYLNFEYIKSNHSMLLEFYHSRRAMVIIVFFCGYVLVAALSLPGAAIMTILGGAIFGIFPGLLIISAASTVGALCAFLLVRLLLLDYVQHKYSHKLIKINAGIEQEGAYYLFALRLVPIMPFFLVNALMALTSIRALPYTIASMLGMLPGTFIYIFLGTNIASIDSLTGILSWPMIFSLVMLGIFPLLAKRALRWHKQYKILKQHSKPVKYDYNVVVIGGGSAGLVAAYISSQVQAKVALIESNAMGGDCLNTGCVPSKSLIKAAKIVNYQQTYNRFGLDELTVDFDFSKIMQHVKDSIDKIAPHDSIERYTKLGVECLQGQAEIIDPYRVKVKDMLLTTKKIVIATGAKPFVPNIPGLAEVAYLTSDNIWDLKEQPKNMIVLGAGPIGLELSQAFARLGTKVSVIEMQDRILPAEDMQVSELITAKLSSILKIYTKHKAKAVVKKSDGNYLRVVAGEKTIDMPFDSILIALGRRANTKGLGIEKLGIDLNDNGTVRANQHLQTNYPNIYVCGDVTGPMQFTHTAGYQGTIAALNALFGYLKGFPTDYRVIPRTTFVDPEVSRVGLNEQEAIHNKIDYDVVQYDLSELDRAIVDEVDYGFVKVILAKNTDKILGVTIVSENSGELITEFVLAMKYNLGLNKILHTIHAYPTMAEANKAVAGVWRKTTTSAKTLIWLKKIFTWIRG